MSDEKIIDFTKELNKAKESDVDKFENYIYSLYFEVSQGKMTMADFTGKITKYMNDNNISQKKFYNIQKKLIERYGYDINEYEQKVKDMGIDLESGDMPDFSKMDSSALDKLNKSSGFFVEYSDKASLKNTISIDIKNDKNNLEIIIDQNRVVILSERPIDLTDNELNTLLKTYKAVCGDTLRVVMSEVSKSYDY